MSFSLSDQFHSNRSKVFFEVEELVNIYWRRNIRRKVLWALILIAYCLITANQFGLFRISDNWYADRVNLMLLDTYANKDHIVKKWGSEEKVEVFFEGSKKMTFDPLPGYVGKLEKNNYSVEFVSGRTVKLFDSFVELHGYDNEKKPIILGLDKNGKPNVIEPEGKIPAWIRVTENKVEVRPNLFERIQIYKNKVIVFRYQFGWRYFLFDFDSPLRDFSATDLVKSFFSSEQIIPGKSNMQLAKEEFLNNSIWFHGPVFFALLETITMALLGTMIASIFGLILSFVAASNINPLIVVRVFIKRIFDFLRAVDTLIWSLLLLRAFGPGLLTGITAIALTETGTLGKLMSEAIENTDPKQLEGITSTGASKIQSQRYGIIPQILPVFVSQTLYIFESNTRSAIIIGAMGSGGIGMLFLSYMRTGVDFENVAYVSILVLITVMIMDMFSAFLRRMIIGTNK